MEYYKEIRFLKSGRSIGLMILGIIFSTVIVTKAAWTEPTGVPPGTNLSISAVLNQGNGIQAKTLGLLVNPLGAPSGLIVYDDIKNPSNTGFVGIGTGAPAHKVDVLGNFNITGTILPYGISGVAGQVLGFSAGKMGWFNRTDWPRMTIQRIDIADQGASGGCIQFFPACPQDWSPGVVETFNNNCTASVAGQPVSYGAAIRPCYADP